MTNLAYSARGFEYASNITDDHTKWADLFLIRGKGEAMDTI